MEIEISGKVSKPYNDGSRDEWSLTVKNARLDQIEIIKHSESVTLSFEEWDAMVKHVENMRAVFKDADGGK